MHDAVAEVVTAVDVVRVGDEFRRRGYSASLEPAAAGRATDSQQSRATRLGGERPLSRRAPRDGRQLARARRRGCPRHGVGAGAVVERCCRVVAAGPAVRAARVLYDS